MPVRKCFLVLSAFFSVSLFFFADHSRAQIVSEGYVIQDRDGSWLKIIRNRPELTIDHVTPEQFEVWGPQGLGQWLQRIQAPLTNAQVFNSELLASYPSPEEISAELQNLAKKYSQTARLTSIGKSVLNRDLWVMKISRNVSVNDQRPEFKFIANMHGDEIVGREIMMRLILELLQKDGQDPQITALLDQVQIYIMPSMNPDGAARQTRGNASFIDLNRNFPEFARGDDLSSPKGRAPETQAVMKFQNQRQFRLSANFHGGAEVVNYPWDAVPDAHPRFEEVKNLSLQYARLAPYIGASTFFENGIVNGYQWYEVLGGMQDWSDRHARDLQITIELSNSKWPPYSQVQYYWNQNRAALLDFIEKVKSIAPISVGSY